MSDQTRRGSPSATIEVRKLTTWNPKKIIISKPEIIALPRDASSTLQTGLLCSVLAVFLLKVTCSLHQPVISIKDDSWLFRSDIVRHKVWHLQKTDYMYHTAIQFLIIKSQLTWHKVVALEARPKFWGKSRTSTLYFSRCDIWKYSGEIFFWQPVIKASRLELQLIFIDCYKSLCAKKHTSLSG